MLTREGQTIRKTDGTRHKYDSAMAEVMDTLMMRGWGDYVDGDAEAPTGWFAQFGRRVLFGDDRGFVWHETYPDERGAEQVVRALNLYYWEWSDDESDTSDAARMLNLVELDRYLAYSVDCAREMCEAYDLDAWRAHGSPASVLR